MPTENPDFTLPGSAPVFTDEIFVQAVRSEAGTKVGYSVGCTKYRLLSIPLRLKLHG